MAQFRHCHVDRADTGVEVAVAVPVAVVDPLGGSNAVFGAADGVGLGGEDLVDKPLQHLPHQVRGGLGEQRGMTGEEQSAGTDKATARSNVSHECNGEGCRERTVGGCE